MTFFIVLYYDGSLLPKDASTYKQNEGIFFPCIEKMVTPNSQLTNISKNITSININSIKSDTDAKICIQYIGNSISEEQIPKIIKVQKQIIKKSDDVNTTNSLKLTIQTIPISKFNVTSLSVTELDTTSSVINVVYSITSSESSTGIYWLQVSNCLSIPVAVITNDDEKFNPYELPLKKRENVIVPCGGIGIDAGNDINHVIVSHIGMKTIMQTGVLIN